MVLHIYLQLILNIIKSSKYLFLFYNRSISTRIFRMWPFFWYWINCMTKTIIWIIFKWNTLQNRLYSYMNSIKRQVPTQVGIHLACSLPKPFLAWAFKRSSWPCRSFTIRISKYTGYCWYISQWFRKIILSCCIFSFFFNGYFIPGSFSSLIDFYFCFIMTWDISCE